jgi:tetratricopeptide (TPR) repeat protein/S1-C subfamily serine protease
MVKIAPCFVAAILTIHPTIAILQAEPIAAQTALQSKASVESIAQKVTVQIVQLERQNLGSGVIVAREGQTHFVLTANHVVSTEARNEYDVITPDGKKHRIDYSLVRKLPGVDLALLQFNSSQPYQVVTIGRSNQLNTGVPAYVAGFPLKGVETSETEYRFSEGEIAVQTSRSLENGYAVAYFNDTFAGMSGGPLLDRQGQLVGIHGSTKLTGLLPSDKNRGFDKDSGRKAGLNLAIPIDTFLRLAPQAEPNLKLAAVTAPPAPSQLTAADLFIQSIDQEAAGVMSLNLINEAIRMQPNFALAYFRRGNLNESFAALTSLPKISLSRSKAEYISSAMADYTEAIRLNPNFSIAYNYRGVLRRESGDLQGAIEDYTQAIHTNPISAMPYNNRGLARHLLKDLEGALADLDEAIRLNPRSAMYYRHRGAIRTDLENFKEAIADFDQSIHLNPSEEAYYLRGQVHAKLSDFVKAIADYDAAILVSPKFYHAYNGRGLLRTITRDYRGAITDFTEVIRVKPTSAVAYLNRGLAYEKAGAKKEAATDFQKVKELATTQGDIRLQQMADNSLKRVR